MSESSRLYPKRPLVGVSAAIVDRGKVLLVQRGNQPLKGMWSLPGGLIKAGENLQDAARRELLEETGITAGGMAQIDVIEIIDSDHSGVRYHYILVVYSGVYKNGTPMAGSDAAALCWAGPEEAQKLELTKGTLAIIKNLTRC